MELACLKCLVILEYAVLIFVAEAPSLLEPSVVEHAVPSWGRTGVFGAPGLAGIDRNFPQASPWTFPPGGGPLFLWSGLWVKADWPGCSH